MTTIHIQIGEAKTLEVENWQIVPDDRQQLVEIVGGVAVQDFGHIEVGDKVSCRVTAKQKEWQLIKTYWDSRELVDVIDEAGNVLTKIRVVVKSYEYMPHFPKVYKIALEFWRL